MASPLYLQLDANDWQRLLARGCGENHTQQFRNSWNRLKTDNYMRDGGHYRKRRFAMFDLANEKVERIILNRAHYQDQRYNRLNGGLQRQYFPWEATTLNNPCLQSLLGRVQRLPMLKKRAQKWWVQAHQFRIETNQHSQGHPTPEGIHQDGCEFTLIVMMDRQNVQGGESTVYDLQETPLTHTTLLKPWDTLLVNDRKVKHGVSAIRPLDPTKAAWRDVMVMTFHTKQ